MRKLSNYSALTLGWITGLTLDTAFDENYYYLISILLSFLLTTALDWKSKTKNPTTLIILFVLLYLCIGSANISSYRGEINQSFYMLLAYLASLIIIACELGAVVPPIKTEKREFYFPQKAIAICALPGALGVALLIPQGIPLLQPWKFTAVSAKSIFLIETLFTPLCLCIHNYFQKYQPLYKRKKYLYLSAALTVLLALPGYRGWIIISALLITYGYLLDNGKIHLAKLGAAVGGIFLIMTGLAVYRRTFNTELSLASDVVQKYDASHLGKTFALLHFSLRESIAISQRLIEGGISTAQSLFFSDILSMLPGKNTAGGEIVAQAYGDFSGVGLTPGAFGALSLEFGIASAYLIIFSIALFASYYIKVAKRSKSIVLELSALLICLYFVHFIHRGIPKPSYIVIPLMLFFCHIALRKTNIKHL